MPGYFTRVFDAMRLWIQLVSDDDLVPLNTTKMEASSGENPMYACRFHASSYTTAAGTNPSTRSDVHLSHVQFVMVPGEQYEAAA